MVPAWVQCWTNTWSVLDCVERACGPLSSSAITILGVVITGAFHEDGFADTADSLGGFSPERRLEILKDSRVGTFGSLAHILSACSVIALAELERSWPCRPRSCAFSRSQSRHACDGNDPLPPKGLGQSYTRHLPRSKVFAMGVFIAAQVACGPAGLTGTLRFWSGLVVVFAKHPSRHNGDDSGQSSKSVNWR